MSHVVARMAASLILASAVSPSFAQTAAPPAPRTAIVLTEEEKIEREARKACKVSICDAFHNRRTDGGDITCSVLKSWRKEQLSRMLEKAKVSWPWGRVQCSTDIKLRRDMLIKAMVDDKHEAKLDAHQVKCEVERDGAEPAQIMFELAPKVTFEKGKAVKAQLGWGKIEAPTLVKGAMWTATATDNTFNVLQRTVVEDINSFIGPQCDEVKDDWAGR